MKRKTSVGGFLVALGGVLIGLPVLLTWRVYRQECLDYDLIAAIKHHDVPHARTLLKQGADGNARDLGDKPMSLRQVCADLLNKFLHRPTKPEKSFHPTALIIFLDEMRPDKSANSSFAPISAQRHAECVQALLMHGADVSAKTEWGGSALLLAAGSHAPESVNLLLDRGCDPNKGREGDISYSYQTPLLAAVEANDLATVQVLLAHGARTEWGEFLFGKVPLCVAIEQGSREIVQELIRHGADPNVQTAGATPLLCAVSRQDVELVQQLFRVGANADSGASQIGTPLYVAAGNGDLEIVRILLAHGANVEWGYKNSPPLWAACPAKGAANTLKRLTIMNLLVAHGALLNPRHIAYAEADYGQNALVESAGEGDMVMVHWLLHHGVTPNAVFRATGELEEGSPNGPDGATALQEARKGGHVEIVALLKKAGANR